MSSKVQFSHRFAELPQAFYTPVDPQPLDNLKLVVWNDDLAEQFAFSTTSQMTEDNIAAWFGMGENENFQPLAMKYAGHQFGAYNPELGDGRGLLLCEATNTEGEVFDIHLKGAGLTPYSRMGDGRAVLRSSIREYLCSEALAGLGIPTTRALGLVDSETPVYREQVESGAMLLRLARTHIRFGHFEHFFYTNQMAELKLLADKVIEWHFPHVVSETNPYAAFFNCVVDQTAEMIAYWQAYGFAHGVMNTDNMSIIGQTFDFGPFGFLDDYEPGYICNHSDYQGRYAYDQQPRVALWNLSALAHSLSPLIDKSLLEAALGQFETQYSHYFSQLMREKVGLLSKQDGDSELFNDMFDLLKANRVDFTRFFRQLSELDKLGREPVVDLVLDRESASAWLERYQLRCQTEFNDSGEAKSDLERCAAMRKVNPKYILRNYLAQQAIEKAQQGDYGMVRELAELLKHPFDDQPDKEAYAKLPPEWGKKMEISCSS
ncbi:protein adenylyltransferase SelO [Vibrio paucivorans]|uniref:Protein nucleotidyltransferase YdiU n=1 Tax=Vibrio paucivorans TaxID=2829489 RepID=A0A9X3CDW9_9VIBR|nr:YdiU family protein [Vibrio paucivorans]MCW8333903.1 YdiU family protein [Vibrio paucivorans]